MFVSTTKQWQIIIVPMATTQQMTNAVWIFLADTAVVEFVLVARYGHDRIFNVLEEFCVIHDSIKSVNTSLRICKYQPRMINLCD